MEQTGSEMEIDLCFTKPTLVALFSVERIRNLMSNGKSVEIDETDIPSSLFLQYFVETHRSQPREQVNEQG